MISTRPEMVDTDNEVFYLPVLFENHFTLLILKLAQNEAFPPKQVQVQNFILGLTGLTI